MEAKEGSAIEAKSIAVTYDENTAIREQMPFSSFVIQQDLRMFHRIFLNCIMQEYIPRNAEDQFFAAVSPCGDKATMSVNIKMFNTYPVIQQMGVLAHEACHVALAHLIGSRKGDPKARNIAEDLLINEYILHFYKGKLDLPKQNNVYTILTFKQFCDEGTFKNTQYVDRGSGVPHIVRKGTDWALTDLNSDEVYKWVIEDIPQQGGGQCDGDCANCKKEDAPEGADPSTTVTCKNPKGGQGKSDKKKGNGGIDGLDKQRIDNHQGGLTKDNASGKLQKVMDDLLKAAEDGHFGSTAGEFAKAIRRIYRKHFPFKDVLDRTFKRELYDYNRGNRRISPLFKQTFVPRVRTEDFKVWAIVDMSGSCEFHVPDFLGYLLALPQFEAVYCIDTQIQHVVKKGEPLPKFAYGCGGTDMNPALKICQDIEKKNPSIRCNFIMLTDGEIPDVTCGPRNSLFMTFTTHLSVHFKKARRAWKNIDISEKLENGKVKDDE